MKWYGFWRSLASNRVRIALALKGLQAEEVAINLLQGQQHGDEYRAVNPQRVVPALVVDGGPAIFQSLAILEYLDETKPEPPLMPKDARGRARVRGLAQIIACDTHPMIVPRIRNYLEKELKIDEPARNRWAQNWIVEGLKAVDIHLANERETGRYCHGDAPTIADICLVSQVFGAQFFKADTSGVPNVMRVFSECMKLDAFDRTQPLKQPGAPKELTH
ncbi:MAG: maleylacetoacetate isomerase [Betaproteobacteria bacterium]